MKDDEKNRKSTLKIVVLAAVLLGLTGGGPAQVSAVDTVTVGTASTTVTVTDVTTADNPQPSESYYANPAQAAHASQLAEQAALSNQEVQDAFQAVDAAQVGVDAAQAELEALKTGTPTVEEIAAAEQKLAAEELNLASLEKTYSKTLEEATGIAAQDILAMRTSGLGWGEIAHELGVHPSTLGLGHNKSAKTTGITGIEVEELAEATARNTTNGLSKGQSKNSHSGIHEPGTGLTSLDSTDTTTSGKSKAGRDTDGASGEKGIAGGNSNGNSAGNSNASGNSNSGGNSDKGAGSGNSGSNSGGNSNGGGNDKGNDNSNDNGHGGGGGNGNGNDNSNDNGHGGGNGGGNGNGGGKK